MSTSFLIENLSRFQSPCSSVLLTRREGVLERDWCGTWSSEACALYSWQQVVGHFRKNPANLAIPLHPLCNVYFKRMAAFCTFRIIADVFNISWRRGWGGGGGWRAVTQVVSYERSNRLTRGVFEKCTVLCMFLLVIPRSFAEDCKFGKPHLYSNMIWRSNMILWKEQVHMR